MGVKRSSVEENVAELSFKQPKQLDDSVQTATQMTTDLPSDALSIDGAGEPNNDSCEMQITETVGSGETVSASTAGNESERTIDRVENISQSDQHKQLGDDMKLLNSSGSFSSTTSSDEEEEDSQTEDFSSAHTFPGYTDISKPSRLPHRYLDPYASSVNSSARKEVPVGPNHQADLPNWEPHVYRQDSPAPDLKFLGDCVVPMPDSSIYDYIFGQGRTDCACRDVGSTRCVRQHVSEARRRLWQSLIYYPDPMGLGLYCMGEDVVVSCNWPADQQRIFRHVVVSNPLSRGYKFWVNLRYAFPSRTEQELLSYYFNVFMLRRRAFQNRSRTLAADSDDDETPYDDDDDDGKGGSGDGGGDCDVLLASEDCDCSVDGEVVAEEDYYWDLYVGYTSGFRPMPPGNFGWSGGRDR